MSGIAGIVGMKGRAVHRDEVKAMCDAMLHRGPDDDGYYVEGHVGLGMRRLSIIDLKNGHQPAWNEEHDICVVTNGEIYNYRELRLELISRGHLFTTGSDTEVIVHLYEEMGEQCIQRLRGMFAFALWDKKKQLLLLARDRLGIRPLYYAQTSGRLFFASEMKALLQLPDIKKEINWDSVSYLFSFSSTPADKSILSGIHKIEPGKYLRLEQGKAAEIKTYWDVKFTPDTERSEEHTVQLLREKLQEAVRYSMVSDVPVGAFLNDELNSRAVQALMARETSEPIKTFSIACPQKTCDGTPKAIQISQYSGSEHCTQIPEAGIAEKMQKLAWCLDEPLGDPSVIPAFMLSELAGRHVKVALSGEGGNELFAGYDKYAADGNERSRSAVPFMMRKLMAAIAAHMPSGFSGRNYLHHYALTGPERYLDTQSLFAGFQKSSLFAPEFSEQILSSDVVKNVLGTLQNVGDLNWLSSLQYLDIKKCLPLRTLTGIDRLSMASSLEVRMPLLDHKLVEFAATIPEHMKIKDGRTKHVFREAMRGILPDQVINKRKQDDGAPLDLWFSGELSSFARDLLLSGRCLARGYFNSEYVEKLLLMHEKGRPMDQHLWLLISFELWCQAFMDKDLVSRSLQTPTVSNIRPIRSYTSKLYPEILRSYSDGR